MCADPLKTSTDPVMLRMCPSLCGSFLISVPRERRYPGKADVPSRGSAEGLALTAVGAHQGSKA